jgi:hypothetical protein
MMINVSNSNRKTVEELRSRKNSLAYCLLKIDREQNEIAIEKMEQIIETIKSPALIKRIEELIQDLSVPF